MHPSKFFNEVGCRTGIDVFEQFDSILKEELKNIHPDNCIKTKITLPVYKIIVEYFTSKNNYKRAEKIMVLDSSHEDEYSDFWADIFFRDYITNHPNQGIKDVNIIDIKHICDAVLPIG